MTLGLRERYQASTSSSTSWNHRLMKKPCSLAQNWVTVPPTRLPTLLPTRRPTQSPTTYDQYQRKWFFNMDMSELVMLIGARRGMYITDRVSPCRRAVPPFSSSALGLL